MASVNPPVPREGFWSTVRSVLGIGSPLDWFFKQVCQSSALVVILLVVLIVVLLGLQALPALRTVGLTLITSARWSPNPIHRSDLTDVGQLGGLTFLYGSVVTSLLAMMLAVPLGVGTAAFLAEVAPGWLRRGGSFLVELLAAIPSVVYGFWGLTFLAPNVQKVFNALGGGNRGGLSILTAGLILAVMVLPYVSAVAYDVCQAVPRAQREGSLALGATRWQTIWKVVLPYARPGILGGCFLALGRAIGETMAVTMLIGNVFRIESLPFGQGATIPSVLALQLPSPSTNMHRSALLALALILIALTVVINVLARVLIWRVGMPRRGPSLLSQLWRSLRPVPAAPAAPAPDTSVPQPSRARRAALVNLLMSGILFLCLVITCVPLFLVLGYITYQGAGSLNLDFFLKVPDTETGRGGLANAIVGSALLVGLASLFALPPGILAAIFLAEYRSSRLVPVVRFFGELLSGVPSIIVGTFVYALVRLLIDGDFLSPRDQFSGWAGALALAIMMIPIVMRASEEALKLVPQTLRNASYALGAHHWQTVVRVTVPAALPAIITGVFLAVARIAGETAPLLLTIFGSDSMVLDPRSPMGALPLYVFRYSSGDDPVNEDKAWAAALVLLAFVMLLNVGIRILTGRRVVQASRAE